MGDYAADSKWEQEQRERLVVPFYHTIARRVVSFEGEGKESFQQGEHWDAMLQLNSGKWVTLDEKLIRPKRLTRDCFMLETHSNIAEGKEREGWMANVKGPDVLLYVFVQHDGSAIAHWIPFKPLQEWFWRRFFMYKTHRETNGKYNVSESRLVLIRDVWAHVECQMYKLRAQ